jgi:F-type H+-transporting ATPase subunit b
MELMGVAFAIIPGTNILPAEATGGINELGVSWFNLLWQTLGFLILLFILTKYAYKPLLRALDERRARAQEIVDKSDQIKKEALDSEQRTREILSNAQREAQNIIATATARQQQILEETTAKQRKAEEQEIAKAQSQIAAERDRAIQQLRREFSDLAVLAASRIVGRELTANPKLQNELINEVLGGQGQPKKAGGR